MNGPPKTWYALEATVLPDASEAIQYGLMEAGAMGTQTDDGGACVSVVGYFQRHPEIAGVRECLNDALRIYGLDSSAIADVNVREVPDRDWLAEWKKSWQPVQVGRFMIAPPWLVSGPATLASGSSDPIGINDPLATPTSRGSDSIIISINPGMAFGTGTHETTRLCLQAIDKYFRGGSFLDVGTGTGVLAIAAAKMSKPDHEEGQPTITACDTDGDAISIARENAALNGVADQINFRVGSIDEQTPSADFVCANLTTPVIVELLPALIDATCGRLVLSGILEEQVEMVQSRLAQLSVTQFEVEQDGEWIAIVA